MYYVAEAQTVHFDEPDTQSYEIWSQNLYNIVLWAPGRSPNLAAQVKLVLANVDPTLVMYGVVPYPEVIAGTFNQQNMIASLTWLFGGVGMLLAAIGLYGVTAYGVEQQTSEIGVRMALGGDRRSVVVMILPGCPGCRADSRPKSCEHRPDAGFAQRITHLQQSPQAISTVGPHHLNLSSAIPTCMVRRRVASEK